MARSTSGNNSSGGKQYQVPVHVRKSLAQFVRKLVELIENSPDDTVAWTRDGTAFLVVDPKRFSKRDLGQWFRSSQFNSFVRQLNFYNFTKVPDSKFTWEFTHPHLQRGDWDSLALIKRKTSNEFHAVYDKEVKALRKSVSDLRSQVDTLRKQLADARSVAKQCRSDKDVAVARSIAVLEAAKAAGVVLDVKPVVSASTCGTDLPTPKTTTTTTTAPTTSSTPLRRARKRRRTATASSVVAHTVSPPSSSPHVVPGAQPPSPTVKAPPVEYPYDVFMLPSDPQGLAQASSTLLDDDDDAAVDFDFGGTHTAGSGAATACPGACVTSSSSSSMPPLELDVAPTWFELPGMCAKPPSLVRGFSGMSIDSTHSVDAYNAFATSSHSESVTCGADACCRRTPSVATSG